MNHLEKTFMEMQNSCISVGNEYEAIFGKIQQIKDDFIALGKNGAELAEMIEKQSLNETEGHVTQKRADMAAMSKLVYKLGRKICHYAKLNNNQVLLSIVDISESKLLSGEENEIMLRFKSILAAGRDNLAILGPYEVTAASLDALDAQYAKLASLPKTINTVSATRKSATRGIKDLNNEARIILDRLDDAIEGMIDNDKIIDDWFEARKIKGRHVPVKKENGVENGGDNKTIVK
jgi:hypothetical protein